MPAATALTMMPTCAWSARHQGKLPGTWVSKASGQAASWVLACHVDKPEALGPACLTISDDACTACGRGPSCDVAQSQQSTWAHSNGSIWLQRSLAITRRSPDHRPKARKLSCQGMLIHVGCKTANINLALRRQILLWPVSAEACTFSHLVYEPENSAGEPRTSYFNGASRQAVHSRP